MKKFRVQHVALTARRPKHPCLAWCTTIFLYETFSRLVPRDPNLRDHIQLYSGGTAVPLAKYFSNNTKKRVTPVGHGVSRLRPIGLFSKWTKYPFWFFFDFFTYKKWPFFGYFENVHVSLVSFQKIEKVVGFQVPRKVYQI